MGQNIKSLFLVGLIVMPIFSFTYNISSRYSHDISAKQLFMKNY